MRVFTLLYCRPVYITYLCLSGAFVVICYAIYVHGSRVER